MKPAPPRFYFSFWSPYSWIAARLLEERIDAACLGLHYTPYWPPDTRSLELLRSLGGDFLYIPMSREKHLYILQDIKRIVTSLGFRLAWPIDDQPWWDLPHLAFLAAQRQGRGREFFWAVHRARWEDGRNVCLVETIRDLACEVGLTPDPVAGAPDDPSVRQEGAEALLKAYRDQVFGVPFFVKGYEKFWGVDRLGSFLAAQEGRPYRYLAGGALSGEVPRGPAGRASADGPEPVTGAGPPESRTVDAGLGWEASPAVGDYDKDCAGGCG